MSSAYDELVASASESEIDLHEGQNYGKAHERAGKWAEVIAEEIDRDFPDVWELKQEDVDLIYDLVNIKWSEEVRLFKPTRIYEHNRLFIPECATEVFRLANLTRERKEIRWKRRNDLKANPPQPLVPVQKLVLSVAGTQIMIDSNEAALAVYTDCWFRGKNIIIMYPSEKYTLKAQVLRRSVGDTSLCVAIFNRLLMRSAFDNVPFTDERCECFVFTGRHASKRVTLYCGNLTEVEFSGKHDYVQGFIPEDEE